MHLCIYYCSLAKKKKKVRNLFISCIFFLPQIYKTYRHSIFAFTHVLIPVWIIHYYLKYHVTVSML